MDFRTGTWVSGRAFEGEYGLFRSIEVVSLLLQEQLLRELGFSRLQSWGCHRTKLKVRLYEASDSQGESTL